MHHYVTNTVINIRQLAVRFTHTPANCEQKPTNGGPDARLIRRLYDSLNLNSFLTPPGLQPVLKPKPFGSDRATARS